MAVVRQVSRSEAAVLLASIPAASSVTVRDSEDRPGRFDFAEVLVGRHVIATAERGSLLFDNAIVPLLGAVEDLSDCASIDIAAA